MVIQIPLDEFPPGFQIGLPVKVTLIGTILTFQADQSGPSFQLDVQETTIEPLDFEGASRMAASSASKILTGSGFPVNKGGTTPSQ